MATTRGNLISSWRRSRRATTDVVRGGSIGRVGPPLCERQELEGHAIHVDVLWHAQVVVGGPAEPAPDHLLAQELAGERPQAEDLGHVPGVPALRQHRDRYQAADALARLALFADGRHDPPETFLGRAGVLGIVAGLRLF
jgi:hypothetical protein